MCLRVEGWGEVGAPACGQQCPGFETTPSLTHPRTPPHAAHLPALQRAIFPGDSELQQLLHIFKLLGTPSEEVWPGVTKLRDWHEFPQWHAQDMEKVFPKLCPAGIDLMMKMFEYDPANRLTVSERWWPMATAVLLLAVEFHRGGGGGRGALAVWSVERWMPALPPRPPLRPWSTRSQPNLTQPTHCCCCCSCC